MNIKNSRVVIVGAGNVGTTIAYSVINQSLCGELVLIDLNKEKAEGEILDLSHSMEFMNRNIKTKCGDYEDCADADIVVITASAPMDKSLNDRMQMLNKSKGIMKSIVDSIMKSGFDGILLIVSNPVDIMTYYAWKVSGLPASQVIGSGTTLDTARLRFYIGKRIDVDPRSIDAYVIGEHGDSELVAWSTATIGGKDIYSVVKDNVSRIGVNPFEDLRQETMKSGWEIFNRKGNTSYGIAASVTSLIKAVLFNENTIYPVSVYLNGQYDAKDVYISVPTIISRTGAKEIVELNLSEEERSELKVSIDKLRDVYKNL